jgi:hypothetical protein
MKDTAREKILVKDDLTLGFEFLTGKQAGIKGFRRAGRGPLMAGRH